MRWPTFGANQSGVGLKQNYVPKILKEPEPDSEESDEEEMPLMDQFEYFAQKLKDDKPKLSNAQLG